MIKIIFSLTYAETRYILTWVGRGVRIIVYLVYKVTSIRCVNFRLDLTEIHYLVNTPNQHRSKSLRVLKKKLNLIWNDEYINFEYKPFPRLKRITPSAIRITFR